MHAYLPDGPAVEVTTAEFIGHAQADSAGRQGWICIAIRKQRLTRLAYLPEKCRKNVWSDRNFGRACLESEVVKTRRRLYAQGHGPTETLHRIGWLVIDSRTTLKHLHWSGWAANMPEYSRHCASWMSKLQLCLCTLDMNIVETFIAESLERSMSR